MLIDDKSEPKPPPDYTEAVPAPDDAPGPSAGAIRRLTRRQSVLYESDMEDPFSNRAAAAGPSSSASLAARRESDGFFGNGTNVLPPAGSAVSGYVSSSGLGESTSSNRGRPLSPTLYDYAPSSTGGNRMSAHGGDKRLSGTAGMRSTYYDSEYETASLHSSPTADLGDLRPLVNKNQPKEHSSSNLMAGDVEADHRGIQPLGENGLSPPALF